MPRYHVTMERHMQTTVAVEAATLWEAYAQAETVDLRDAPWQEVATEPLGVHLGDPQAYREELS